jgi:hypothetical protein
MLDLQFPQLVRKAVRLELELDKLAPLRRETRRSGVDHGLPWRGLPHRRPRVYSAAFVDGDDSQRIKNMRPIARDSNLSVTAGFDEPVYRRHD